MSRLPTPHDYYRPQQPTPRPRRLWRFRRWLLIAPLACMCAAWFLHNVVLPPFEWVDVMDVLHVSPNSHGRYTRLVVLALVLLVVVWVARILKSKKG
jgi:hypothetical protein